MYELKPTKQFKKDQKRAKQRGKDLDKLRLVILQLQRKESLAERYRDHALLEKQYKDCRECHIEPDWLFVYKIAEPETLFSVRTGSRSDLF